MINFEYFCLPALYVKDISSDVIHMVGTDAHDRLYLDANGNGTDAWLGVRPAFTVDLSTVSVSVVDSVNYK